jgi:hypothetical protein
VLVLTASAVAATLRRLPRRVSGRAAAAAADA